jgi:hypothetical protein
MGYRSEVAIAFYSKDKEHSGVIKLWMESNFPYDDWKGYEEAIDVKDSPEYSLVLHLDHVKWYESYPEVERIDKLMNDFGELFCSGLNPTGACEFMRLGEELQDIETQFYGDVDYILDVNRTITVNR